MRSLTLAHIEAAAAGNRARGCEAIVTAGGSEAIALVKDMHPRIIVLHLTMPEVMGFARFLESPRVRRVVPYLDRCRGCDAVSYDAT